jgi:hypothetical protein
MDFETKTEKLEALIRHIEEVQKNCRLLADRLMAEDKANFEFAKKLIANSYLHDNSKFSSLEWMHLTRAEEDDEMLDVVIKEHNNSNFHHPEAWSDGIRGTPDIYIAEMTCDWKARSTELGTDLKEWIDTKATKRWGFGKRDKVYKKIMKYVDLLLEPRL